MYSSIWDQCVRFEGLHVVHAPVDLELGERVPADESGDFGVAPIFEFRGPLYCDMPPWGIGPLRDILEANPQCSEEFPVSFELVRIHSPCQIDLLERTASSARDRCPK